jgi:hypothetical protein
MSPLNKTPVPLTTGRSLNSVEPETSSEACGFSLFIPILCPLTNNAERLESPSMEMPWEKVFNPLIT